MKTRRVLLIGVVVLFALANIAAMLGQARYYHIRAGRDATVSYGKAGISLVRAFQSGTVKIARGDPELAPGATHIKFTQKLLDVRFYDAKATRVTKVTGSVYVFFKLGNKETKMWNTGLLSIFYFDPWFGDWRECPTVSLNDPTGNVTLSCRVRNFGLYGVGIQ